jgi:hypothetical protein
MVLLSAGSLLAQSCADVNGDGAVDISDMLYMLNEHVGGPAIPAGKGDIDYRQGYTAGEIRYFIDYVFCGAGTPGCPPYDPYTLFSTNDTLLLPSYDVPAGSSQFVLPIYLVNHASVGDMVLPLQVNGLGSTIFFDSLHVNSYIRDHGGIVTRSASGSTGVVAFAFVGNGNDNFAPGVNLIADAYFHCTSSPGGTISMDTTTLRPHTFLNYLYGDYSTCNYFALTIAVPKVVVTASPGYPAISLTPDSLFFQGLVGSPDPAPQSFTVVSNGVSFDWNLTKPTWVTANPTSGTSGQSVYVTPNISGLAAGIHYGDILVYSTGAVGSPKKMTVKLTLKQQYPSLDANCDGIYNITDVVAQINYIFGGGQTLCDPCSGLPMKK